MLMRLAFSIATAVHTDILIMDEWMSVGDAEFQAQAEERLRQVIDNTGILVLASHQPALIERECNRGIELSHGAVVQDRPLGPIEPTIRLLSTG
jgi:lipopolysaccharide transport system ATP-binding protein